MVYYYYYYYYNGFNFLRFIEEYIISLDRLPTPNPGTPQLMGRQAIVPKRREPESMQTQPGGLKPRDPQPKGPQPEEP